ncbi:phosphoenolpyruvate-protein phosphotransferase [Haladaptatus paucihalophilus DX253]|uniref:Phosphoenolpyruvate-protein phosphotransferase n=1 Tax=Haladaptatus paucihalophilus DX253 TaxID=797209 RepID=E7QV65_HALPU|nr:phosphoenolpyruvate--protein phosphotransferase [Haladaptatus paucihalophilus]EFW91583.1 phosphoenolpyruvate-protein phosphotransferase [Haladaptatus paucihalophilus DX253]
MTTELSGTGVTPRAGVGRVVWYRGTTDLGDPPDPTTVDPEEELAVFESAQEAAHEELERERERTRDRLGEDEAEIFDAHRAFLDDPEITGGIEAAIENGLPAPHAIRRAFEDPIARFENLEGSMAERADDLRDVRDRLLRLVTDGDRTDLGDLPNGSILVAERLTPSDTAQLDPDVLAGFATIFGGRTSHAAIFARSLGIPAVVGVGDELAQVGDGRELLVDGEDGTVVIDPDDDARSRISDAEASVVAEHVSTADGREIEVAANVGTLAELDAAAEQGADGIGLFRTEFLFLDRDAPPDEQEQYEAYTAALTAFPGERVVVRTLDVGGDKPIPYLDAHAEENPFLGVRGIRRSLASDSNLFDTQLRALLRAAGDDEDADGSLAVMFPLVATVEELDAALSRVESVAEELAAEGIDYAIPELGVMIETPGSVFAAEALAKRVSFLSIGTNDLTQYVMAASRENDRTADLHDPLYPAVLRAIRRTVTAGHDGDAWVGMCGEMAGDPDLTELLVGLGLDELSMSAITVPDVKANVREVDADDAREHAERILDAETRAEVRRLLSAESSA